MGKNGDWNYFDSRNISILMGVVVVYCDIIIIIMIIII